MPGVFVSSPLPRRQDVVSHPYSAVVSFVLGPCEVVLGIRTSANGVSGIDFLSQHELIAPRDALTKQVATQLQNYLSHPHHAFDLPLDLTGTPFQRRVWEQLCRIPAGHPISYGELAGRLDSGARAVGNACRHNPLPIIVPCHRVVSVSGLGGYSGAVAGESLHFKQALLDHEARYAG